MKKKHVVSIHKALQTGGFRTSAPWTVHLNGVRIGYSIATKREAEERARELKAGLAAMKSGDDHDA